MFQTQLRVVFWCLGILLFILPLGFMAHHYAAASQPSESSLDSTISQPFSCNMVSEIPPAECNALVSLFVSTDGPDWLDKTNWLVTDTPSNWFGVSIANGRVTGIDLASNGLMGSIPDLSAFTQLEYLNLSNNSLSGTIPDLSALTQLRYFYLYNAYQLGGTIPNLSTLTQLQTMAVSNTQVSGEIPDLSALAQLRYLDLSSNQLTGRIPDLSALTQLRYLYLGYNQLSNRIPDLSGLTQLQYLGLDHNMLEGEIPASIMALLALIDADLGFNKLYAVDPSVQAFLDEKDPDWAQTQTVPAGEAVANSAEVLAQTSAPPPSELLSGTAQPSSRGQMQTVESTDPIVLADGSWTAYDTTEASGGQYLYSSGRVQDSLTLNFTGTWVSIVYIRHPALGSLGVVLDGVEQAPVVTNAETTIFGVQFSIDNLPDGPHSLRVYALEGTVAVDAFVLPPQPVAEPTARSTETLIPTLDVIAKSAQMPDATATGEPALADEPTSAVESTPTPDSVVRITTPVPVTRRESQTVESTDPLVLADGTWTIHGTTGASGGQYLYSSGLVQDSLTLTFTGTWVDIIYVQHPALGTLGVVLDGHEQTPVVTTAEITAFGARLALDNLPDAPHILRVYALEGTVAVDAFVIPAQPGTESMLDPTATLTPAAQVSPEPTTETLAVSPSDEPTLEPEPTAFLVPTATLLPLTLPWTDPLEDTTDWQTTGFWQYAPYATMLGSGWLADAAPRGQLSTLDTTFSIALSTPLPRIQLSFWQKGLLAAGDLVSVSVSLDGGASWTLVDQQWSLNTEWQLHTVDLTSFRNYAVWLRFSLQTAPTLTESETTLSFWLDEVSITGQELPTLTPVPTNAPVVIPTERPTATQVPTDIPTETPWPTPIEVSTKIPTAVPIETPVPTLEPTVMPSADAALPAPDMGPLPPTETLTP